MLSTEEQKIRIATGFLQKQWKWEDSGATFLKKKKMSRRNFITRSASVSAWRVRDLERTLHHENAGQTSD